MPNMHSSLASKVFNLHIALQTVPRHRGLCSDVCESGIYLFFETGQVLLCDGKPLPRIVRVGTHLFDGRLADRLANHFTSNRHGSIFRKHLGNAIINSDSTSAGLLHGWLTKGEKPLPSVEERVSRALQEDFSYVCLPVPGAVDRKRIERGLIGLLASFYRQSEVEAWRGSQARTKTGAHRLQAGLWNVLHLKEKPLTNDDFELLIVIAKDEATKRAVCSRCASR